MINEKLAVKDGINSFERVWEGVSEPIRKGQVINQVYETNDYSIFRIHKRNRNVITRRDMLIQAKEGIVSPIVLNGEMIVIDGQNRLHHSMIVGAPVKYIVDETLTVDDISRMNRNQEKWSMLNHIESYANEGREDYEKLIELLNDYYSDATLVSGLCLNLTSTSEARKTVENGTFKIKNYEIIISFFQYLNRFLEETKANRNAPTTKAVYQLFRIAKFDKDRLIKKVRTTRFDEELKDKRLTQTAVLNGLLDSYNDRLSSNSSARIEYYIKSNGQIIIDEEHHNWAKEKTANDSDQ